LSTPFITVADGEPVDYSSEVFDEEREIVAKK
jgi:hypothetical protein